MATIYIPKTIPELIELSEKIIDKHYQEEDKSPLGNIDMAAFKTDLNHIKETYEKYLQIKEVGDQMREELQKKLGIHKTHNSIQPGTIRFSIVQIRDILKGINRERVEELSVWGYALNKI